ncbi:hypothetical protein K0M31_019567 [Melipona bicolor]|uniref:Gustatory receptor n=1 Tax=Melipona bicolor TaxID=60889 RepID=A0AA40G3J8_9HYME|nr:hypothetical protein K0M31_019567 [Melipona bicolor]
MKNKIFEAEKIRILTWRPETQYESLSAIIWANEIFGLRIFEFGGRLRYSWSIIYVSVCIVLYFIMHNMVLSHCEKDWPTYQDISYKFVLYVNIPILLVCIVLGFVNTENSKKIIARYEQIDNILESFGIEKNYLKTFIYIVQIVSAWCILIVILFILGWIWCSTDTDIIKAFYLTLLLCLPIIINCLMSVTFNTFIRILRDKLHKMNTIINEVHQSSNVNGIDVGYKMQQTEHKLVFVRNYYNQNNFLQRFVEITRQMHFEIVSISRELNQIYSYQLLLNLAMEFIVIICTLYNLYFDIISSTLADILHYKIVVPIVLFFIFSAKIIVVNHECTCFQREIEVTAQTLREIEISCTDGSIKDELQQFSLQLILYPLYFTAAGCVFLNNQLTTKFFGTLSTYLAIIVQMSPTSMQS